MKIKPETHRAGEFQLPNQALGFGHHVFVPFVLGGTLVVSKHQPPPKTGEMNETVHLRYSSTFVSEVEGRTCMTNSANLMPA